MISCWGSSCLLSGPELNIFHTSRTMGICLITSQVINIVVVILLEPIVRHESTMIAINISVSTWTIHMIMESFCGASSHGIFGYLLGSKTSLLWREATWALLLRSEVTSSVPSHVKADVCVPACAICVVYSGLPCLRNYAAHFVS